MNRVAVTVAVVAVAVVAVGGTLWVTRPAGGLRAAANQTATPVDVADLSRTVDEQRRTIAALRAEIDALRRAQHSAGTQAAAPSESSTADPEATEQAVRRALDDERKHAAEDAAKDEAARTVAWEGRLVTELGLSEPQRTSLDEVASWAEAQRGALAERADKEGLDANAVRAEIATQRDAYEKRMKALLTPAQHQEFDAIQGVDRRPPTFSRMPWILGDRGVPR